MVDTEWSGFPNRAYLLDTDELLAKDAGGGGVNIPGSAVAKLKDGVLVGALGSLSTSGVSDWNDVTNCRAGIGATLLVGTAANGPGGDYFHSMNFEYASKDGSGNVTQLAVPYSISTDKFWMRGRFSGAWGAWREFLVESNAGGFRPSSDNLKALGGSSTRFSVVYAGTGSISTSDERAKQDIGAIPDEWLDAWATVEWQRYRFIDAVAEKGEAARWHIGLIAQRIDEAFTAAGLDARALGLICFDEWAAETRKVTAPVQRTRLVTNQVMVPVGEVDGQPAFKLVPQTVEEPYVESVETGEVEVVRPAGDRWSLRYDECGAIEAAYQRREIARLRTLVETMQS